MCHAFPSQKGGAFLMEEDMSKKYVKAEGVALDQAVQHSPFLPPGEHEVELTAVHDDGTRLVLSFKKEEDIHIHSVEKETLEDGLEGTLGIFSKYNVKVELTDGVCGVAYGSGYNIIHYPSRNLLLEEPTDPLSIARYISQHSLPLASPKIVRISQL